MGLLSSLAESLFGKPKPKDEALVSEKRPEDREESHRTENSRSVSDYSEDEGNGSGEGGDE